MKTLGLIFLSGGKPLWPSGLKQHPLEMTFRHTNARMLGVEWRYKKLSCGTEGGKRGDGGKSEVKHGVNRPVCAVGRGGLVFVCVAWSLQSRIPVAREAAQFGKVVD